MLQPTNRRPPYTRLEWIGVIIAATFALGTLANVIGCHADELRECEEQRASEAASMASQRLDDYERISALEDRAAEHESEVIAAELYGHDQGLLDCHARATATATAKVWPQVLSVFTSRKKYDKLAGVSSPIELPPLDANRTPRRDAPRSEWLRRRVVPDDWLLAHRTLPLGSMARLCQRDKCVDVPVLGRGTYGARCSSPELCEGNRCDRRTSDPARPGDNSAWWWTIQRKLDGPCTYRAFADVTPLVCESLECMPMTPATVTAL